MAQPDIAAWADEVKKRGLLKDRGNGDVDWMNVGAPDGSIFELRRGRVYTRAVWSEHNPPERPFAFWRLVASEDDRYFPKNLFICTTEEPRYLTAAEVHELIFVTTLKEVSEMLGPDPDITLPS